VPDAEPRLDNHRTRPRRRGGVLDVAILEAVLAEIERSGYQRFSVERVAERARASKASIYRRWPNRAELVTAAVLPLFPDPADQADTGSLRGDVLSFFTSVADILAGPAGTALRGLVSDVLRDPALAAQLRGYTRGRSLAAMRDLVTRAADRGELPSAAVTAQQLEAGLSLLRFYFLTHDGPVPDQVITEIVDEVVIPLLQAAAQPGRRASR
jgi:AcrR family transcriptional regulator